MIRSRNILLGGVLLSLVFAVSVYANTIRVPQDQPTIQAGIDAAVSGDTVLVSPGTYTENINYLGKSIRLLGRGGPDSTVLQPSNASVNTIRIVNGEGTGTELAGFSLQGGTAKHVIEIIGSEPQIHHNVIRNNVSFVANATEIGCFGGNPRIERNLFIHNRSLGGVGVFAGSASIVNNTFDDNSRGFWSQGSGVVAENNIASNSVDFGIGAVGFAIADYNCVFNNNPNYDFGATAGPHDITANPLYSNPPGDNYTLSASSLCIDAGDPSPEYNDPDGSRNDMGAFPACQGGEADCDGDSLPNQADNCPQVYNPFQEDGDGDGAGDVCDNCLAVSNPGQADGDFDGKGDACDNCPADPNPTQQDTDADGPGNPCDNCPLDYNPSQSDVDSDSLGDICDACAFDPLNDADGDGHCADVDNCPSDSNANQSDIDGDGIGDVCDNCPNAPNPTQADTDADGTADACDNCPSVFNSSQIDADHDGIGNACDPCAYDSLNDSDGDAICGNMDNCPAHWNPNQADTNGNGIGDVCECACACHADPFCDGVANVVDVVKVIDRAFRNADATSDAACAEHGTTVDGRTDLDCDGSTNVVDVVTMVGVAFRGGDEGTLCGLCGM